MFVHSNDKFGCHQLVKLTIYISHSNGLSSAQPDLWLADQKKRYTVRCLDDGCPWVVRAVPLKKGPEWHISSCVATHMCRGKKLDGKDVKQGHRQLTSEFIAYRLSNSISSLPTMSIKSVMELVEALFHYKVKYGKAWKAKQAAFKMLYGGWEEAYNRLPRLLGAMAATNPGMVHVVEPYGQETTNYNGKTVRVFGRAFWAFEQCVRAFEHCRPVISVDGTFLTGQYKGTLLVAIGNDANNRLLPLAFALVEAENNHNWEWFFHLLRTKVLPHQREICVISDRHQGILNAVQIDIPGHAPLHHRWCMRHFCSNFYRACGSKELSDDLQDCCLTFTDRRFANLYNRLLANRSLNAGGLEFLNRHIQLRNKWARAYDEDGRRYGQMTSNMAECFNNVLKGVRALPVTAIVQYTFTKLNEYFLNYSLETDKHMEKLKYPPKVDEFVEFESRKADSQVATIYDNEELIYQVNEPGGTTADGVQHGGRAFKVSLKNCDCTCGRPMLLHLACSHLLTAARTRHVDVNHPLTVRESEFSILTTKRTWAPRFHPYFDQSQWPEYHGIQLWPHGDWKVIKRGRRKTKRFRGDMDGWGRGGRECRNDQFQEPPERARCGKCNSTGHNARKCTQRKRAKGSEPSTSQPSQHGGPSQQVGGSQQSGPSQQYGPSQHGGPSHQVGASQQNGPNQQYGPSQHGGPSHQVDNSQQAPTQQRRSQQRVSQQTPRQQRGRRLGLTRGRVGGGRGRGGGRMESMIGYLSGPFPYVSPF